MMDYEGLGKLIDHFRSLTEDEPYYIGESEISGNGVFAKRHIRKGELIGTIIDDERKAINDAENAITNMGSHINHQFDCNAKLVKNETHGYYLVAIKNIPKDEEITTNYKNTPWYIDKNTEGFVEL